MGEMPHFLGKKVITIIRKKMETKNRKPINNITFRGARVTDIVSSRFD
jgi:hypothetical protein